MRPVAFIRETWKKWEKKRSEKRKAPTSTFLPPSPRRSQTCSGRRPSNASSRTTIPRPTQISFEHHTKPNFMSRKWVSIRRHNPSVSVKERASSAELHATALRNHSHPTAPLTPSTNPPEAQYPSPNEQDNQAFSFRPTLRGKFRQHPSHPRLPSVPPVEINYNQSDVYNLASFKLGQSSFSSLSSPELQSLNIVEKPSTDPRVNVRDQTARRLATSPSTETLTASRSRQVTNPMHLNIKPSTSQPQLYDRTPIVFPPEISTSPAQTGDARDFPLSLFPQPPPLLVRKKVPKPLVLRPSNRPSSSRSLPPNRPSSSRSLLLSYSPLGMPNSSRPGSSSLRSPSQTSLSSMAVGRPLHSVSPPPTSPPSTPLPAPPVDMRLNSLSVHSKNTAGSVRRRLRASESVVDHSHNQNPSTEGGDTAHYRHQISRQSQPSLAASL